MVKRIIISTSKKILTEHWKINTNAEATRPKLTRCNGCNLDQNIKKENCSRWKNKNKVQRSITELI